MNNLTVVTMQLDKSSVNGSVENSSTIDDDICSNIYPKAILYYRGLMKDNVVEAVFIIICGIVTSITIGLFLNEFRSKHYKYKDTGKRNRTLLLLGLYPHSSFMSCFALFVPRSTVLVDLIAACYLSFCIHVFINLLIQYYGNKDIMIRILSPEKVSVRTPPCCCCCFCLPTVKVNTRNVGFLQTMIMQVAIVQPLLLFIKAVLWADDNSTVDEADSASSPLFYTNIVSGISTLFSIYGLQVSVTASQKHLDKHRIKSKFLLLQFVLIFTNLQKALFGLFLRFHLPPCEGIYGGRIRGSVYHNMMIIVEMFILSILARFVYRKSESRNLPDIDVAAPTEYTTVPLEMEPI